MVSSLPRAGTRVTDRIGLLPKMVARANTAHSLDREPITVQRLAAFRLSDKKSFPLTPNRVATGLRRSPHCGLPLPFTLRCS